MSYNNYCQNEVYCICCNKNIRFNNLDKHVNSLGHINKLPVKDEKLNNKAIKTKEFNIKMKELGINIKKR